MSWYYGTFSCGHEGRVNIIGKVKDRQWKADTKFSRMCEECYEEYLEKERQKANKEAEEKAKEMDLPELSGSEKQIAWANTLRQTFIDNVEKIKTSEEVLLKKICENKEVPLLTENDISLTLDYILTSKINSTFYINNRYQGIVGIIESLIDYYKESKKDKNKDIDNMIEQEIIKDGTVIPDNSIFNGVAEIEIDNNKISIKYEKMILL